MAPPSPSDFGMPPDDGTPDLSHLSEEERQIILQVLQRQKAEERQEEEIAQKGDKELWDIERQIQERKEIAQRLIGTQDDAICQICQKTKFADGIGHKCFYCQLRSCARCGGRTTSKQKTIWACSLCQKRQQILARTGKWFQQGGATATGSAAAPPMDKQMSVSATPSPSAHTAPTQIARQHSERAISCNSAGAEGAQPQQHARRQSVAATSIASGASEKGGGPVRRQSTLRRQSSMEHDCHAQQQQQSLVPQSPDHPMPQHSHSPLLNGASPASVASTAATPQPTQQQPNGQLPHRKAQQQRPAATREEQSRRRDEVAGRPQQQQPQSQQSQTRSRHLPEEPTTATRPSTASGSRCATATAMDTPKQLVVAPSPPVTGRAPSGSGSAQMRRRAKSSATAGRPAQHVQQPAQQPQHVAATPCSSEEEEENGYNEVAAQPSPQPVPQPPSVPPLMQSASLETGREPPDFSEKELLRYIYDNAHPSARKKMASISARAAAVGGSDRAGLLFGRHPQHHSLDFAPSSMNTGVSGAAGPSGVSSGALARRIRNYLSNPAVSWQPSADQRRLIGHIVLQKPTATALHASTSAASASLQDVGLKVVGGRNPVTGRLGAFVSRVRPGSVADAVGQLRAGDEVLEWNGHTLQNVTPETVYNIVQSTKADPRLELIVSRSLDAGGDDFLNARRIAREQQGSATASLPHSQSLTAGPFGALHATQRYSRRAPSPLVLHHHPSGIGSYYDRPPMLPEASPASARLEISLLYLAQKRELIVSLCRAYDLAPRVSADTATTSGGLRNPYVKLFLLPDRSERSRRQTKVCKDTLEPVWNEHFFYEELDEHTIAGRVLEVTLWDFDPYESHTFLGETLIELVNAPLNNQPFAYALTDADDDNPIRLRLRQRRYSSMTPPMAHRSRALQQSRAQGGGGGRRQPFSAGRSHEINDYWEWENGGGGMRGWTGSHSVQNLPRHIPHAAITNDAFWANTAEEGDWNRNGDNDAGGDWGGGGRLGMVLPNGYLSDQEGGDWASGERRRGGERGTHRRERREHRHHRGGERSGGASRRPQSATALRNIAEWEQRHAATTSAATTQPARRMTTRPQELREQEATTGGGYGSDGSVETLLSGNSAQSMQNRAVQRQQQQSLMQDGAASRGGGGGEFEQDLDELEMRSVGAVSGGGIGQQQQQHKMTMKELKERKKSLMTRLIPGRNGPNDASKRLGFARSEEVGIPGGGGGAEAQLAPPENNRDFIKQNSKESTDSSDNWLPIRPDRPLGSFVENLGPGQVVGRQALGSTALGELQAALTLEPGTGMVVDIMQARALNALRQGAKTVPGIYVKAYLMEGKNCVAKAKTQPTKTKSACPQFRQKLVFADGPRHKMLQLTVLADYGRIERKAFLGVAQLALDELQLSREPVLGWYKLFQSSSLNGGVQPPQQQPPTRKDSETSLNVA